MIFSVYKFEKYAYNVNMPYASSFLPFRMVQARKMTGLSLRSLSGQMGGRVSHTMLSRYETGRATPDSEILACMAKALGVAPEFFYRSREISLSGLHFRKRVRLKKSVLHSIEEHSRDYFARFMEIEEITNKQLSFDIALQASSVPEAMQAAQRLRELWNLGGDPILNLIQLLENKGIKIYIHNTADAQFDGLSAQCQGCAMVVLASHLRDNLPRMRMTLAHELAHLVLRLPDSMPEKGHEACANAFAGAFLMPETSFAAMFGGRRDKVLLSTLLSLKSYFGVSLAALMMRANQLKLVSDSHLKSFFIAYNKKGFRTAEPGEYRGAECSQRFDDLVSTAVLDGEISMSKGAALWGRPLAELRRRVATLV